MTAVFKREFKSYFNNMLGYTIIAGTLLLIAIYIYSTNFAGGYPNIEYSLYSASGLLFTIVIPLLTMKSFAEERRQKTDQLLLTSPLSVPQIVVGKFFGTMAVFGIAMLIIMIYPPILNMMGDVNFRSGYSAIFGMFFMSCALAAIGIFISSLTENQIISAVATLCTMLLLSSLDLLIAYVPSAAKVNFFIWTVVAIAIVIMVLALTKSVVTASVFAVLTEGTLIALFKLSPTTLEGTFGKFLGCFNIFSRMQNFIYGMFDFTTLVYYLTVAALFLFFTVQSVEKRRWS